MREIMLTFMFTIVKSNEFKQIDLDLFHWSCQAEDFTINVLPFIMIMPKAPPSYTLVLLLSTSYNLKTVKRFAAGGLRGINGERPFPFINCLLI